MKRFVLVLTALVAIIAASCSEHKPTTSNPPPLNAAQVAGTWEGLMQLTKYAGTDSAGEALSDIQFVFDDTGAYSVTGSGYRFPPAGSGVYTVMAHSIDIHTTSPYTTEFDWRLILCDTFAAEMTTDSLLLAQFRPLYN